MAQVCFRKLTHRRIYRRKHGKDAVLVRTKWLLEYHIAGNFVDGKFSIRQKFSYILGIVYITLLDKNSMLSGIAQGPVKSIHFCYCFPKRT